MDTFPVALISTTTKKLAATITILVNIKLEPASYRQLASAVSAIIDSL